MTCQVYIAELLVAHADRELSVQELAAAEEHVASCARCRASLADYRRIKTLVRASTPRVRVPADVRMRIRAALGGRTDSVAVRETAPARRDAAVANRAERAARWLEARPIRMAIPFAAIASVILLLAIRAGGPNPNLALVPGVPETPVFDLASASYDGLARGFIPNVATESTGKSDGAYFAWVVDRGADGDLDTDAGDLARAYGDAGVPEEIYDFTAAGYRLYGGRIDQSVDGWPMSYTLYRGGKGEILSICLHAPDFAAPVGARYWAGSHSFFAYKDHSLCLTFSPSGHFVSILVARESVTDLLRDVTLADSSLS